MAQAKHPPLETEEAAALAINMLITQALFLVIGFVGAAVLAGLQSGDWAWAVLGFGWWRIIAASLQVLPLETTTIAAVALAALLCVLACASERRALKSERGRESVYNARRGVNGEMPRLPVLVFVPLMLIVGFCEELAFRFVLMGLIIQLLAGPLPYALAAFIAAFFSVFLFWFAHVRYRDLTTTALTLVIAGVLVGAFLISGSLAVVAAAHALYNVLVLLISKVEMRKDPDYFGGPAPTRALLNQLEAEEQSPIRPAAK